MSTRRMSRALGLILGTVLASSVSFRAYAHTPHDDVFDIEFSPNYAEDNRMYAIVRSAFLFSTDRGQSWTRSINGLNTAALLYRFDVSKGGQRVYLATLGDGLFVSGDAGASWAPANSGLESGFIDLVVASPFASEVALVADRAGALYRTQDGGSSWQRLEGDFGKPTAAAFLSNNAFFVADHLGRISFTQTDGETWSSFANDGALSAFQCLAVVGGGEADSQTLLLAGTSDGRVLAFASTGEEVSETVVAAGEPILSLSVARGTPTDYEAFASAWDQGAFVTRDGGRSWNRAAVGLTKDPQSDKLGRPSFSLVRVSPNFSTDETLLLAGYDGLFRSFDAGRTWTELTTLSIKNIVSLSFSPDYERDRLMVLTNYVWGAFGSTDGGQVWKAMSSGLKDPYVRRHGSVRIFAVEFSPEFETDSTLYTSTWYDFFRSQDAGAKWDPISPLKTIDGTEVSGGGPFVRIAQVSMHENTIFIATTEGEILRSVPGSKAFERVYQVDALIGSVVLSPAFAEDRMIFIGDESGVHISDDGGDSWRYLALFEKEESERDLVFPGYPDRAKEAWGRQIRRQRARAESIVVTVSPTFGVDGTLFATVPGGLAQSADRGSSWQEVRAEPFDGHTYVESLALSPAYAQDRKLIVSLMGLGLFISQDGGSTFREVARELRQKNVLFGHFPGMTPRYPAIAFSPNYESDATLFGFSGRDLFRSSDGGKSWRLLASPSPSWTMEARAAAVRFQRKHRIGPRKLGLGALMLTLLVGFTVFAWRRRRSG